MLPKSPVSSDKVKQALVPFKHVTLTILGSGKEISPYSLSATFWSAFFPPCSLVNIREACRQRYRRQHCISLSSQLSSRCKTQLMWGTLPLLHLTILAYVDSLKDRQTFKTCPLSFSLLRTGIRSSASAVQLSMADSAAFPADFCVSSPRERPFQRVPGAAGGCFLAELVGSLQLNPGCSHSSQGGRSTLRASASSAGSKLEDGEGRRGQGLGCILSIAFICWSL